MSKVNELDYQRYMDFYNFVLLKAFEREDEERAYMADSFEQFLMVEHLTYEEYREAILDYTLGYGLGYMDDLAAIIKYGDGWEYNPMYNKELLEF